MKAVDELQDAIAEDPESEGHKAGWEARLDGKERNENPYPDGPNKAQWLKGWESAEDWLDKNAW